MKDNVIFRHIKPGCLLSLLFFLAVIILSGIIAGNMPLYDDDLVFANAWGCARHLICPEENFDPLGYAMEHRQLTNGRLGDMFTPLIMMIPGWVYGILYSLGYGIILLLMMRITKVSFRSSPLKAAWIIALTVLLFPWMDVLFTRAIFFNYFPSLIFTLLALIFFIRRKKIKGLAIIPVFLVCFLAGIWHELMPVVLFPSAVLYCLVTRRITRNQIIVVTGMALGLGIIISAPSFFNRPDQLDALIITSSRKKLAYLFAFILVMVDIIAFLRYCYYNKKINRERDVTALIWALLLPSIPSILIMLTSVFETRMCLLAMILSLSALFYSYYPSEKRRRIEAVPGWGSLIICVGVIAQLIFVACNAIKVRRASEDIIRQAVNHPDDYIYYDLRELLTNETLTLYKSPSRGYINKVHSWNEFADYTGYKYTFNILPPALKDFDLNKAQDIADSEGFYYYDTYLLADAPCDSTQYIYGTLYAVYEDGKTATSSFMGTYFEDINGKPLIYLFPYYPDIPRQKPTALEIVETNFQNRYPLKKPNLNK